MLLDPEASAEEPKAIEEPLNLLSKSVRRDFAYETVDGLSCQPPIAAELEELLELTTFVVLVGATGLQEALVLPLHIVLVLLLPL